MGNLKIRKLTSNKRLFAGKADHKHKYNIPINIEVNSLDNRGNIYSIRYYTGRKCEKCRAMILETFIRVPDTALPVIRLKTSHTHRIDVYDVEFM